MEDTIFYDVNIDELDEETLKLLAPYLHLVDK